MAAWLGGGGRDSGGGRGENTEPLLGWTNRALGPGLPPPPTPTLDFACPQSRAGHGVGSKYFLVSWFPEAH